MVSVPGAVLRSGGKVVGTARNVTVGISECGE